MDRHDETAQIVGFGDGDDAPAPGDPVGRVNLPEEPDSPPEFADLSEDRHSVAPDAGGDQMREKVLYGLMAIVMMILAMVVILQGVFEQKMPV